MSVISSNKMNSPIPPYRNISWILVGRFIEGVTTMALIATLARAGGSSVAGTYYGARSIGLLALACAELGLSRFTIQSLARHPDQYRSIFANLLVIRVVAYILVGSVIYFSTTLKSSDSATSLAIFAFVCGFLFISVAELFLDTFRANENLRLPTFISIAQRLLYVTVGGGGYLLGYGINWVLSWFVISSVGYAALSINLAWRCHGRFGGINLSRSIRSLIAQIGPFTIATILGAINARVGVILLYRLSDEDQIGYFGVTMYLVEALMLFAYAIIAASFPNLSRLYKDNYNTFLSGSSAIMKVLLFIGLAFFGTVTIAADDLVTFLYGEKLAQAAPLMRIAGCAAIAMLLNAFMIMVFQTVDRPRRAAMFMACLLVTNVSISLLLVPRYGAQGAFIGLAIAEWLLLILQVAFVKQVLQLRRIMTVLWKLVLASAGMIAIVFMLEAISIPLRLLFAVVAFCFIAAFLRIFDKSELRWLRATAASSIDQ
jgi:O-antigen/teichoic acid export membrane protein